MLKVVVFDGGYGGECFADKLGEELPVVDVIRVIDWRNADKLLMSSRSARRVAVNALRPYIGKVDLIVLANHLLTVTSLKFFRRKYKNQRFVGFDLKMPDTFIKREVIVLTTKAVSKTISYYNYLLRIKRKTKTIILDDWPDKIDDGELTELEISEVLDKYLGLEMNSQIEVVLACAQFSDIRAELSDYFGKNVKIYDSFDETLRKICKLLNIRGGIGKKTK
ncbi:hypothetical protein IKF67_02730 [Candidatus Saccharibacteria bacterium]|nr:hypothetical protein [Candidatus Saccharibacteria bacterium]